MGANVGEWHKQTVSSLRPLWNVLVPEAPWMLSYIEVGIHPGLDTTKLAEFGGTIAFFSHSSIWVYFFIHSHNFLWYIPWSLCLVHTTTSMSSAIKVGNGWDGMGWSGFVMRGLLDVPAGYLFVLWFN